MSENYYAGVNNYLLRQIPAAAKKIFEVGCGEGNFGAAVKSQLPGVYYSAIEIYKNAADMAASKLDVVWQGNFEIDEIPLSDVDCIVFGDVLEHLQNPLHTLVKAKKLLNENGQILCSIPNIQHCSILETLLSGDFPYADAGLLDKTHIKFFTYISFYKLLLDAGYIPEVIDAVHAPPQDDFFKALLPALQYLNQDPARFHTYTSAYQYIFRARINPAWQENALPAFPITFIVPTNNQRILRENFLSSPIFQGNTPHQVLVFEGQSSAAQAIEAGLQQAQHDFVVFAHQDVYLPTGWDIQFTQRVLEAEQQWPEARLFGLYGSLKAENGRTQHGHIIDRHWHRQDGALPQTVTALDELLFGFRKNLRSFVPDAALGYHLYAADISQQLTRQGYETIVVDALCLHHCNLGLEGAYTADYAKRLRHFIAKWQIDELITPAIRPEEVASVLAKFPESSS